MQCNADKNHITRTFYFNRTANVFNEPLTVVISLKCYSRTFCSKRNYCFYLSVHNIIIFYVYCVRIHTVNSRRIITTKKKKNVDGILIEFFHFDTVRSDDGSATVWSSLILNRQQYIILFRKTLCSCDIRDTSGSCRRIRTLICWLRPHKNHRKLVT